MIKKHFCNNNKPILNHNIHFRNYNYISNKSFNLALEQNVRRIFLFPQMNSGFCKLIGLSTMVGEREGFDINLY